MARVVVLPATFQGECNRQLQDSLIHTQREVDIGSNAVRAKDATDAGAHMVEPIRLPYRANTELNASTDERHALVYSIQARACSPTVHVESSWWITFHVPPIIPAPWYCLMVGRLRIRSTQEVIVGNTCKIMNYTSLPASLSFMTSSTTSTHFLEIP